MILTAKSPALALSCPTCQARPGVMCIGMSGRCSQRNTVHPTRATAYQQELDRGREATAVAEAIAEIRRLRPVLPLLELHLHRTVECDLTTNPKMAGWWSWSAVWRDGKMTRRAGKCSPASVTCVDELRRLHLVVAQGMTAKLTPLGRAVAEALARDRGRPMSDAAIVTAADALHRHRVAHGHRLTAAALRLWRPLFAAGRTNEEIAAIVGCSPASVCDARCRAANLDHAGWRSDDSVRVVQRGRR